VARVCPQLDPVKEHLDWIKRMLGAEGNEPPEEENADVLRRMAADGDDLTKPRHIDFHHLFAREEDAVAFQDAARNQGHQADHDFWNEPDAWLTTVHIKMVPSLEEITAMELTLNGIARSLGGEPDGWGCMEVGGTPAR
jgi:Regulator of ribonuclease activity B